MYEVTLAPRVTSSDQVPGAPLLSCARSTLNPSSFQELSIHDNAIWSGPRFVATSDEGIAGAHVISTLCSSPTAMAITALIPTGGVSDPNGSYPQSTTVPSLFNAIA